MNLSTDAAERLTALAETEADYVAVDVAELRTLIDDHPENAAYQAWAVAYGARSGKMRIARATLRALLRMPAAAAVGQLPPAVRYPSTQLRPPQAA